MRLLLLLLLLPLIHAEFLSGNTIILNETQDSVTVAANQLRIEAPVKTINGVASKVIINAPIEHLRVAAEEIIIHKKVDQALLFGNMIETDAPITNLTAYANTITLSGPIKRATIGASRTRIQANITKATINSKDIYIAPTIEIQNLNYTSQKRLNITGTYHKPTFNISWTAFNFVSFLLVGFLLFNLPWIQAEHRIHLVRRHPKKVLGTGLITLLVIPATIALAMVTIIGIPAAIMALGIFVGMLYIAKFFLATALGSIFIKNKYLAFTAGWLTLLLLNQVPYMPWLITPLGWITGIGAITYSTLEKSKGKLKFKRK
ncbi:MAG: hypothetical protein ACQESG_00260 [Nanobdellota archaeon]